MKFDNLPPELIIKIFRKKQQHHMIDIIKYLEQNLSFVSKQKICFYGLTTNKIDIEIAFFNVERNNTWHRVIHTTIFFLEKNKKTIIHISMYDLDSDKF